jgi:hypothetical protein
MRLMDAVGIIASVQVAGSIPPLLPVGSVVPIHSVSPIKVRVRMGFAATG